MTLKLNLLSIKTRFSLRFLSQKGYWTSFSDALNSLQLQIMKLRKKT